MSTPIITRAKRYTNILAVAAMATGFATSSAVAHADWNVDFSRRGQQTRGQDLREPASTDIPIMVEPPKPSFFESLFDASDVAQEIVVLNTDKGFVPSTIRVKKGLSYQIHIVNVNEKEKKQISNQKERDCL